MRVLNALLENATTVALSSNSTAEKLDHIGQADVTASITSANPANKTFLDAAVDVTDNFITIASHGFTTGMKCTLTTSGVLPGGLAAVTDYYVIAATSGTIKLATSQANALAGTAIDITSAAGGGTHTVAVTTTIAGSVKLQKNNEPEGSTAVWFDVASSSQNFSGTTSLNWALADIGYREVRAVTTVTSGTVTVSTRINGKGF